MSHRIQKGFKIKQIVCQVNLPPVCKDLKNPTKVSEYKRNYDKKKSSYFVETVKSKTVSSCESFHSYVWSFDFLAATGMKRRRLLCIFQGARLIRSGNDTNEASVHQEIDAETTAVA